MQQSNRAPEPDAFPERDGILPAVALWEFDHDAPVRRVLHRLKYANAPWIGLHLGRLIAQSGLASLREQWDLVVPVPLHRRRWLERGYNQAEWIARGLAEALSTTTMSRVLVRSRHTETQTNLTRDRRHENVRGAFVLGDGGSIVGASILLVDDTLTTGSTLGVAAGVLRDGGASCIQPLAVARAALRMAQEHAALGSVIPEQQSSFPNESSFFGNNL